MTIILIDPMSLTQLFSLILALEEIQTDTWEEFDGVTKTIDAIHEELFFTVLRRDVDLNIPSIYD